MAFNKGYENGKCAKLKNTFNKCKKSFHNMKITAKSTVIGLLDEILYVAIFKISSGMARQ